MREIIREKLRRLGFGLFKTINENHETYENKILSGGGIRITIYDDIAEIICPKQEFTELVYTNQIIPIIENLLKT